MAKYKVDVSWSLAGTVEVEAESLDTAREVADAALLPQGEYITGSWHVDNIRDEFGNDAEGFNACE